MERKGALAPLPQLRPLELAGRGLAQQKLADVGERKGRIRGSGDRRRGEHRRRP